VAAIHGYGTVVRVGDGRAGLVIEDRPRVTRDGGRAWADRPVFDVQEGGAQ
jgi:hypothetical protein